MNEQQRYGQLIREAMARRGMTQRDFTTITGWSQSVLSDTLNGKRTVTPPEVVQTFAKVLGVTAREQLAVLGYLQPDEPEPGVAYVIREDDPRAELLARLDGMTHADIAMVTGIVGLLRTHTGDTHLNDQGIDSEGNDSHQSRFG